MPSWSVVSCFRNPKNGYDGTQRRERETALSSSGNRGVSVVNDEKKGISVIELIRKSGASLGLKVSGGIDKEDKPRIVSLRPGRIAYRSDCLAVGDHILSINGIRTSKLKHDEIVTLLKNAGEKVILEIEYDIPSSTSEGSLRVCPKVIQLQLEKENDTFGFTLRGGFSHDKSKSKPLYITHVRIGGPANREGSIKAGDRLLAINGINFSGATLQEALNILKQINGVAVLTIEYDVSIIDAVKNACGPLLIEIDKAQGTQLGVNLTCLSVPEPAIVIESIKQASVAERCGALHVGDHILCIDGTKVDSITSAEAMQLLKLSSDEIVKLEILPVSQMAKRRYPEIVRKGGIIPHYMAARASFTNSCYNTLSSLGNFSGDATCHHHSVTPPLVNPDNWCKSHVFNHFGNCVSCPSLTGSLSNSISTILPSVGHVDTTEVILPSNFRGFGFVLQSSTFSTHVLSAPPIIRSIEPGSVAERSGVLQVGDRVLAVNNTNTVGLTLDEVTQMVFCSHPKIALQVEFDVTEAVVPSSGTFAVKLMRRGESSLGLTLTVPKDRQHNDPLIISAIEKGSVSHRSGTIQPGDKLLSVDSIRMENCSVEDALTILQSCNDIVTLRIRKDETYADEPDTSSVTVCTIELIRNGGLLGITVSGTEEPFKPIVISGLTKNGLAERSGALQIGDRILAINGVSLRGKPLSEAVQILQSCGDTVTLKISRTVDSKNTIWNNENEMKKQCMHCTPGDHATVYTTPLSSVDSALESWDSCNLEICNNVKTDSKLNGSSLTGMDLPFLLSKSCKSSSQVSINSQHSHSNDWENRSHSSHSCCETSERHSTQSKDGSASWTKVLEDLQTCGQSQLLRQIEYTILGHEQSNSHNMISTPDNPSVVNIMKSSSDTLSVQSLEELNAQIEQLNTDFSDRTSEEYITDLAVSNYSCNYLRHFNCDSNQTNNYRQSISPSFSMPFPVEVHKVTLFKDQIYEDFGFSVSDAQYEQGVYIQCIRSGGPADLNGLIKPLDRILKVNNVNTYNHGCCLTVPLIASSGDRIELVVSRPAYDMDSMENTSDQACEHQLWINNLDCESNLSPFSSCESQALTKTL